jgi:hypothetical protein
MYEPVLPKDDPAPLSFIEHPAHLTACHPPMTPNARASESPHRINRVRAECNPLCAKGEHSQLLKPGVAVEKLDLSKLVEKTLR